MNRKYRKTIVAGNWKMHKTATETKLFAERLKGALPRVKRCSSVPVSYTHLDVYKRQISLWMGWIESSLPLWKKPRWALPQKFAPKSRAY